MQPVHLVDALGHAPDEASQSANPGTRQPPKRETQTRAGSGLDPGDDENGYQSISQPVIVAVSEFVHDILGSPQSEADWSAPVRGSKGDGVSPGTK